ncbi:GMC oxidoreductase [Cystobasidium minutum MCA 4210]|uniref:GMC oxidoreductase n=1 Tax=Cystobasidium minutum MCA 4210 TaxID=1397322 RepID=UPI0034CD1D50|eukprot:jgi/Rhomi1/102122/CE102121_68769
MVKHNQRITAGLSVSLLAYSTFASNLVQASEFQQHNAHTFQKRAAPNLNPNTISTNDATQISGRSYDYVIVGGGTAGLAVAARLAEDSQTTVAVIEGGGTGDEVMERILAPASAYYIGIAGPTSDYDWHFYTSNQTGLGNRPVFWPRGKVLGGSSAVNGVYMTQGSKAEHDTWASLNNGTTWDFEHIHPYYKKHQTFEPPSAEYAEAAGGIVVEADAHGYNGPIHYGWAGYLFEQIGTWIPTWANLGVGTVDPAAGVTGGSYVSTSAIRQSDQVRSYSRNGYFPDPKPNVDILTGFTVTKVNFATNNSQITATGVSFMSARDSETYTVQANREVILAAGVIGSPQILQLSGVGPAELLQSLDIEVVHDLPGVGAHLQDHVSTSLAYTTTAEVTGDAIGANSTFSAEQLELWRSGNGNQSLFSAPNEAITYANFTTVLGASGAEAYISQVRNDLQDTIDMYGMTGPVAEGYKAIYQAELSRLVAKDEPAVEFLMANTGWGQGASGKVTTLQFAIQHPFSRGALRITTTDPFSMPSIDPGYLTHPRDIVIMREAFKYLRNVATTAPLSNTLGSELYPGQEAVPTDDDEAIDAWIRSAVGTEYHPAGTCSMLPAELGGVVDEQTRVHGINNLRVIDTSIIPVGFAAHLCSPAYAIAELGAALVKGEELLGNTGKNSSSSGTAKGTSSSTQPSASASVGAGSNANTNVNSDTGSATLGISGSSLTVTCLLLLVTLLLA